jgi:hypothetical protein
MEMAAAADTHPQEMAFDTQPDTHTDTQWHVAAVLQGFVHAKVQG